MSLLTLLAACRSPLPTQRLEGPGAVGELGLEGERCHLRLASAALRADGDCEVEGEWIHFNFRGGAGEGTAVARLESEALVIPLGARPGEFDLRLSRAPGRVSDAELDAIPAPMNWSEGRFLLMDGEAVVGTVELPANAEALVDLFDAGWLTPEPTLSPVVVEGPDLLLAFPVEPSLSGEGALLRVNRPTGQVVVPMGPAPTDADRRLRLAPGSLDDQERVRLKAQAQEAADRREREVSVAIARDLARACPEEIGEPWTTLLAGYRVGREGCVVTLTPEAVQQGRRLRARVGPEGELP